MEGGREVGWLVGRKEISSKTFNTCLTMAPLLSLSTVQWKSKHSPHQILTAALPFAFTVVMNYSLLICSGT